MKAEIWGTYIAKIMRVGYTWSSRYAGWT